jgi:CHAD domain-containing protein
MSELLAEVHETRIEIKGMRNDLNGRIEGLADRMEKMEAQQAKTSRAIGELRLSVLELAYFGERIYRLETEVFKQVS